jgi:epoxyqueuosine reductase
VRKALRAPPLAALVQLDEPGFRALFAGSPIKRTGRARFVRNVLIAIGNSGDVALADAAARRLDDPAPLVRGAAVWALGRLDHPRLVACAGERRAAESDPEVLEEWEAAVKSTPVARKHPPRDEA